MLLDNAQTALRDMASRFARARRAPDSQEPAATGRFVIAVDAALLGAIVGEPDAAFRTQRPPRREARRA